MRSPQWERAPEQVRASFFQLKTVLQKWLLAAFWLFLILLLIGTSYFTVPADSIAVVQRFGKYVSTAEPGLHFKIPFGIDKVTQVPVRRQLKLEFGFGSPNASNPFQVSTDPEKEQDMVTGDLNSARVEWVVQYRIDDPKQYLFSTQYPEDTLRAASEAVMREIVGDRTIDEVVTFGRQEIEAASLQNLQAVATKYQLGLKVDLVQLKNINPPQQVQESFNEVNSAQQERERSINIAQGEFNKIIPRARGEAERMISEAEGYAAKRINEATGDVDYFTSLLAEYLKAPDVTHRRLYLETMSEVLPRMGQKLIIDDAATRMMPFLLPATLQPQGK
jgi:membrane protease subunit HflK